MVLRQKYVKCVTFLHSFYIYSPESECQNTYEILYTFYSKYVIDVVNTAAINGALIIIILDSLESVQDITTFTQSSTR